MKKVIKKIVAVGMVAAMAFPLAACGNGTGNTDTSKSSAAGDTKEAKTIDNKDIKIGVSIWSSTDVLGSQCKRILDEAADALGVQIQYVDQGHVSEKVTSSVEQLVAAGCQGIIICNSSDTEMTSAIKTANDNKVYLSQFFRIIDKDKNADIYKLATDSPYYIGAVHENEPENGEKLVEILLNKGDRNIGLIGWEQGDATWLGRWEGYKAGVEKWNKDHPDDQAKLSEPQYAGTSSEGGSKAAEALMAADPGLDALIPAGGGGDPLQGAIAAVERAGKTKDIDIVSSIVIFYYENKMDAKAQERYNSAIKSTDKNFVAELNYNLGQYYIEKNNIPKAKKYLQDSYKASPNAVVPAGFLLSQIALSEKDNATAEKYLLEMSKATQDKNSEILGMLGSYYIGINNLPKAEDYLKKSITADSKNSDSLLMLLTMYESKKDTANINSIYNKLKTIVPKGLNKELGITYAGIGNAELSEKYFQKSINEDKDNESKMFLGQLYFLTGKQTEGINLVKEAVNAKVKGADEVLKQMQSAGNKSTSTKK